MAALLDALYHDPSKFDNENVLRVSYEYAYAWPWEKDRDIHEIRFKYIANWNNAALFGVFYLVVVYVSLFLLLATPFKLKYPLILWNGGLAIFSIYGTIRTWEEWLSTISNHGIYSAFQKDSFVLFVYSKYFELGDTVLLALRKRPLSLLHCYHHMSVLIITVESGAEQLGPGRWFMCMNFGAHAVMYTYYTLVSCGWRFPKWLSASVTTIQIVQLLTGVAVSCALLLIKTFTEWPCQQSWLNLVICFFIYISYSALFLQFFQNAYLKKTNKMD